MVHRCHDIIISVDNRTLDHFCDLLTHRIILAVFISFWLKSFVLIVFLYYPFVWDTAFKFYRDTNW